MCELRPGSSRATLKKQLRRFGSRGWTAPGVVWTRIHLHPAGSTPAVVNVAHSGINPQLKPWEQAHLEGSKGTVISKSFYRTGMKSNHQKTNIWFLLGQNVMPCCALPPTSDYKAIVQHVAPPSIQHLLLKTLSTGHWGGPYGGVRAQGPWLSGGNQTKAQPAGPQPLTASMEQRPIPHWGRLPVRSPNQGRIYGNWLLRHNTFSHPYCCLLGHVASVFEGE